MFNAEQYCNRLKILLKFSLSRLVLQISDSSNGSDQTLAKESSMASSLVQILDFRLSGR